MDHSNMGGEYHNEENIVDTSLPSELQPKHSYNIYCARYILLAHTHEFLENIVLR